MTYRAQSLGSSRLPTRPPVAPVALIRAAASAGVSHVTLLAKFAVSLLTSHTNAPPQPHAPGSGLVD